MPGRNGDWSNNHGRTLASSVVGSEKKSCAVAETTIASLRVVTDVIASSIVLTTLVNICEIRNTQTQHTNGFWPLRTLTN